MKYFKRRKQTEQQNEVKRAARLGETKNSGSSAVHGRLLDGGKEAVGRGRKE